MRLPKLPVSKALGVTEIKRAIDLLSTATHTTADVSEESFEQSKQIKTEAEDLSEIVQEQVIF